MSSKKNARTTRYRKKRGGLIFVSVTDNGVDMPQEVEE